MPWRPRSEPADRPGRSADTIRTATGANAYAERFVRSIREECLDRLIFFGERRLLRSLDEFVAHYHGDGTIRGSGMS